MRALRRAAVSRAPAEFQRAPEGETGAVPRARLFARFVPGRPAGAGDSAEPSALVPFLDAHDPACPWTACAFGRGKAAAPAAAAPSGGHLRVGLEDGPDRAGGTRAAPEAERVATIGGLARATGRAVASTAEAGATLAGAAP